MSAELGLFQCDFYIEKTDQDYIKFYVNEISAEATLLMKSISDVVWSSTDGQKLPVVEKKLFVVPRFLLGKAAHQWFQYIEGCTGQFMQWVFDGGEYSSINAHMFRRAYAVVYMYRFENPTLLALSWQLRHKDLGLTCHYFMDPPSRPLEKRADRIWAIPEAERKAIRVFVVFESGLFTFVHGLLSTLVAAAPRHVWQAPSSWLAAWDEYQVCHDAETSEAAGDLSAWIGFFARYNARNGLTYVSLASLSSDQQRLLHDMVRGCELFLTAHEYVHAIAGHHDPRLDAREVEAEADRSGARIAAEVFRENGVNPTYALCGIALVLLAIGQHQQQGPHAHFEARLSVIEDELLPESADQLQARESITAWTDLFSKFVALADHAGEKKRNSGGL